MIIKTLFLYRKIKEWAARVWLARVGDNPARDYDKNEKTYGHDGKIHSI